ncbi:hypothetical protein ABXW85_22725, partial [Streptococcus suis]
RPDKTALKAKPPKAADACPAAFFRILGGTSQKSRLKSRPNGACVFLSIRQQKNLGAWNLSAMQYPSLQKQIR